jgi:hypothetical protein
MNTLRDFCAKEQQMQGFWHLRTVTERQVVVDALLLLQMLESGTFVRDSSSSGKFILKDPAV